MTPRDYWLGWVTVGAVWLALLWAVIYSAVKAALR